MEPFPTLDCSVQSEEAIFSEQSSGSLSRRLTLSSSSSSSVTCASSDSSSVTWGSRQGTGGDSAGNGSVPLVEGESAQAAYYDDVFTESPQIANQSETALAENSLETLNLDSSFEDEGVRNEAERALGNERFAPAVTLNERDMLIRDYSESFLADSISRSAETRQSDSSPTSPREEDAMSRSTASLIGSGADSLRFVGDERLRGITELLSQIDHARPPAPVDEPDLVGDEPVLQLLSQNQRLTQSSDIARRRRHDLSRAARSLFTPESSQSSQLANQRSSQASTLRGRSSRQVAPLPFHSTHGIQVAIGSDYRSARLHSRLHNRAESGSRLHNAPVLFSAFQLSDSWSIRATRNPGSTPPTLPTAAPESDPFDQWESSFWFGVTTVNPAQVSPEFIFEQMRRRGESVGDVLHCVVCARPGVPMELYVEGAPVRNNDPRNRRVFRERAGSIGALSFPDPSSSALDSSDQPPI